MDQQPVREHEEADAERDQRHAGGERPGMLGHPELPRGRGAHRVEVDRAAHIAEEPGDTEHEGDWRERRDDRAEHALSKRKTLAGLAEHAVDDEPDQDRGGRHDREDVVVELRDHRAEEDEARDEPERDERRHVFAQRLRSLVADRREPRPRGGHLLLRARQCVDR